jgi:hypothetical protein
MDCGKAKARVPRDSIESTSARLPEQQTAVTGHELVLHTAGQQIEEDTEEDVLEFDLEDEVVMARKSFLLWLATTRGRNSMQEACLRR